MRFSSFILLLFITLTITAQPAITYRLGLNNIHHHELAIHVTFTEVRSDSLVVRMPNSSPGRYAEHNFVKNVYEEQAYDASGRPTAIRRTSPYSWKIPVSNGTAMFSYTLFGNYADGTYTGIDAQKLHLNMPATFVYAEGLEKIPVNLIINLEDKNDWSVATQLVRTNDSTFSAPDYYYFYDSPTMAGAIDWRSWKVDGQTIEVAMLHEGSDAQLDAYVEWIKKIVEEEKNIYGELPDFDYGRYTFLLTYNPWVHGDGMEHRNSTICSSNGHLATHASRLISTVAHEFFHAWNIERIRPRSLEPFDFNNANLSGALWFGEGFTSYYDDLVLVRTQIKSPEEYVSGLTRTMNYVINAPGRLIRNPIQMSYNAPFVDAATANDQTNYPNNFVSYYSYGAVIGLGLDLMLRTQYSDIILDDYMRYVWENYGKPEKPYTIEDLQHALGVVTKDPAFAKDFFDRYIYDSDLPDFKALLANVGISMELVNPNATDLLSAPIDASGLVSGSILRNSSLYDAGVEKGDQILSIAGQEVSTREGWINITKKLQPGNEYTIKYLQMGNTKSASFTAKADQSFKLTLMPEKTLNKKTLSRRNDWLLIR